MTAVFIKERKTFGQGDTQWEETQVATQAEAGVTLAPH